MSLPQGFGNAVAAEAALNQGFRSLEIAQVPGRNVEGLDAAARAEHPSDHVILQAKRLGISTTKVKRIMFSAEAAFGTAHGRGVQDQPEVRGQAEPAGMGDALTIAEQNVRGALEPAMSRQHGGYFTKRKQARQVGKGDGSDDVSALEQAELGPAERHHDGNQLPGRGHIGDVRRSQYLKLVREGLQFYLRGQFPLQGPGFGRFQFPTMW